MDLPPTTPCEQTTKGARISSKQDVTQDITAKFRTAASALEIGELVKDAYFTLFEAVGALEIMDPKMDSGYLAQGETLEDDYDVLRELLPEEVVGIMDEMLCYEMAWHMGHPLSQTLFTSFYIDRLLWPDPKILEHARFYRGTKPDLENSLTNLVLRAYCLALVKTCDFVHRRIGTEHYYEEEDFVSNLYHRKLLTDFDVAEITDLMDQAIIHVAQQKGSMTECHIDALLNRLKLRKALLTAVTLDVDVKERTQTKSWEQCLELLPTLSRTKDVGLTVKSSFSAKIQRRLASSVPPRPVVNVSFEDACAYLTKLCQYGAEAYRILDFHSSSNISTFVSTFQSRTPQPSVYVRCLLQSLIINDMKVLRSTSIKQLLFDDLEELVLPAGLLLDPANDDVEAPQDPRFQIVRKMEAFLSRSGPAYIDIFRAVCMNRSRMRRMLCHLILDWDNVQLEAENLDVELREYTEETPIIDPETSGEELWSFPLSSWTYYHKLRQMEWIVQMGFELDINRLDELAGMYWYLQHLANIRLTHLQRIRTFTTRRLAYIVKPTSKQQTAFSRSFSFLNFAMLEASATQSFAEGLFCLFSFLTHFAVLPAIGHGLPYSTPALRYALRMRPFLPLSLPEVPSYPDFISVISFGTAETQDSANFGKPSSERALSILDAADQALRVAKKDWEAISKAKAEVARCVGCEDWWRTGVKNVLRACIAGNIAIATARKAVTNADVSARDLSKFNLFEQYAAAAYCPGNSNVTAGGNKLTCPTGNCPLVSSNNVTTVYEFDHSLVTDVTGYIAVDKTRGLTVLSFRGSHTIRNFLADADFVQVPTDICDDCEAHQGIWDSWLEARVGILAALKTTAAQNPRSKVVVTGHSLGGAIADIAAAEIRKMGVPADLYTFGAPRIAGRKLSDFITNQNAGGNFRITHFDDPVPRMPPLFLGFVHISPEYFIDKGNDIVPTANDIKQLSGDVNMLGNTGEPFKLDIAAHLWYFGKISGCSPHDGIQWK